MGDLSHYSFVLLCVFGNEIGIAFYNKFILHKRPGFSPFIFATLPIQRRQIDRLSFREIPAPFAVVRYDLALLLYIKNEDGEHQLAIQRIEKVRLRRPFAKHVSLAPMARPGKRARLMNLVKVRWIFPQRRRL